MKWSFTTQWEMLVLATTQTMTYDIPYETAFLSGRGVWLGTGGRDRSLLPSFPSVEELGHHWSGSWLQAFSGVALLSPECPCSVECGAPDHHHGQAFGFLPLSCASWRWGLEDMGPLISSLSSFRANSFASTLMSMATSLEPILRLVSLCLIVVRIWD